MKRIGNELLFECEINGKKRVFNFGNKCYDPLCKAMGVAPKDLIRLYSSPQAFKTLRLLIYYGAQAGAEIAGLPPVSELEVLQWFDDIDQITTVIRAAIAHIVDLYKLPIN